ncbi:GAF domain-containing protein [Ornithinimicrobium sp. LYQ92]|uniref:sensor histidine kinase n=1 Tax=Serinicoccus sp. LYQ92 TaxID=3378798 RepID=UPI00385417F0
MTGTDANYTDQGPAVDRPLGEADFEDLVQEVRHRMDGARDEQARLRLLIDAVVTMAADLDLDSVLARIVSISSRLVDARYAALGVLETGPGQRLRTFIHHGVGAEVVAEIGELPAGHGLLGRLIDHPEPLRLHDLADHPQSYGFPPGHPPMHSFLGVPVRIRETVFGNLYLTEKGGGVDFTAQDEAIVVALAGAAGVVIENARLYEEAARRERWLQATAEVTALLSGSDDLTEALAMVVGTARVAAEADVVWIVTGTDTTTFSIRAVAGVGIPEQDGLPSAPASPTVRHVIEQGESVSIEDLDQEEGLFPDGHPQGWPLLRSAVLVPLGPPSGLQGALVLAWTPEHADRHRVVQEQMPAGFARQAALALQVLRAREDQFRLAVLEDRDRIARDLHDLVIQRLFALGLRLQVIAPQTGPEIGPRLENAVDELDTTIKDIRRTIFALGAAHPTEDVQAEVSRIVDRAAATLKFRPELRFDGPVRTLIPEALVPDLLAVVGEALSNASRHADPSRVHVVLAVGDEVVLTVTDDGRGIPEGVSESGIANLRHRAEHHGGDLAVESAEGGGTTLRWRVPLR